MFHVKHQKSKEKRNQNGFHAEASEGKILFSLKFDKDSYFVRFSMFHVKHFASAIVPPLL